MAYILLIVEPTDQRRGRTEAEGRELYASMVRYAEDLKSRGLLRGVESLTSHDDATRVRMRNGKPSVLDGPFIESKEMVGGFFLVDCNTREEAIALAKECPAAQWCTVEVRALGPCFIA